jgi:hypothetical protein
VPFIAPALDEATRVEVPATLAIVVDELSVGKEGKPLFVGCRQLLEGQIVDDDCRQIDHIHRATRQVDQVLETGNRLTHANRTGRIGACGGQTAIPGARTDGNRRQRI